MKNVCRWPMVLRKDFVYSRSKTTQQCQKQNIKANHGLLLIKFVAKVIPRYQRVNRIRYDKR